MASNFSKDERKKDRSSSSSSQWVPGTIVTEHAPTRRLRAQERGKTSSSCDISASQGQESHDASYLHVGRSVESHGAPLGQAPEVDVTAPPFEERDLCVQDLPQRFSLHSKAEDVDGVLGRTLIVRQVVEPGCALISCRSDAHLGRLREHESPCFVHATERKEEVQQVRCLHVVSVEEDERALVVRSSWVHDELLQIRRGSLEHGRAAVRRLHHGKARESSAWIFL